jgi:competence protein ComEC
LIIPLSFLSGIFLYYLVQYFPYLTASLSAVSAYVLVSRKKFIPMMLICFGVFYPFVYNTFDALSEFESGPKFLSGYFTSPAVTLRGGYSQEFEVVSGGSGDALKVLSGRKFEIGREHDISARVSVPPKKANPGARERDPYAVLLGVRGTGETVESLSVRVNRMREDLNGFIKENLSPDAAGLVMAVITGSRWELRHELRQDFRTSGLAHLLSISGTHFGLFAVMVYGFFRLLIKYLPVRVLERVTLYLTPSQGAAVFTVPFLLFYLGISGGSIPSVRAFIMVTLFLFGLLLGRRGYWLNFLLIAAVVILLGNPEALFSLSFQLSFTAVLFIGFFLRGAMGGQGRFQTTDTHADEAEQTVMKKALLRVLIGPLLVTIAATVGIAPLVSYYFHYSSVISPLSNLLVTPLVCFVLVPVSLLGSFLYLLTGSALMAPVMGAVSGISISLVRAFSSVPYCSLGVPPFPVVLLIAYYMGFVLYWSCGKRSLRRLSLAISFLPAVLYLMFSIASGPSLGVTFLDAGRADTSVIELPDGKVVVLDTGRSGGETEEYLRHRGIETIDALALTHAHKDHMGGADRLLERFHVKEVWDNGRLLYPRGFFKKGTTRRRLRRGDYIEGEGYRITALHPYPGFYTSMERKSSMKNNDSLVLRLDAGGGSVFFTGDIETEAIEDMLHLGLIREGRLLKSDIIKIPHHGLRSSYSGAFVEMVSPEYAIVSSDRLSPALREALHGRSLLLTGSAGAVKVEERGGTLRIKTSGDFMMKRTLSPGEEIKNLRRLFSVW